MGDNADTESVYLFLIWTVGVELAVGSSKAICATPAAKEPVWISGETFQSPKVGWAPTAWAFANLDCPLDSSCSPMSLASGGA